MAKTHKYGAVPTVVDGIRFASKKEAKRYGELKLLVRAKEIESLELQTAFPLYAWDVDKKCATHIGEYLADFSYWDIRHKKSVVEDVKGFRTPLYKWKKKHAEAQYNFEIREV